MANTKQETSIRQAGWMFVAMALAPVLARVGWSRRARPARRGRDASHNIPATPPKTPVLHSTSFAVGGGLLRTGCGPGPLEPDLVNASVGNTVESHPAGPHLSTGSGMNLTINGQPMDVPDGLTVDTLLDHLRVKREYTAVALNREVTPKSAYASTSLSEGDRVEIVRPMGGG